MNFTYDSRNIVQSCFFQTPAQLRVKAQTRLDKPQFGDLVPVEVMDILAISRAFIIVVSVKSSVFQSVTAADRVDYPGLERSIQQWWD